jgi:acyl transferase domain-containing protein/NAD(P)H-dependent flavin oxidoreductase YrpB (nitropropane dioxygenase family)
MSCFDILVLTPPAAADASLAIAACRAGARGFLDLEYAAEEQAAWAALERLERFTNGYGVKLGRDSGFLLPQLADSFPRLRSIILAGGVHPALETWIALFRRRDIEILLEATRLEEAQAAERLQLDGLILKGHEAGGRVGAQTAFVLVQQWRTHAESAADAHPALRGLTPPAQPRSLPFWVQGGIGLNSAAACLAAGAAGVVLDSQVLLARESPLREAARRQLEAMDGGETVCLGERLGEGYRMLARPGLAVVEELRAEERRLLDLPDRSGGRKPPERLHRWREAVRQRARWNAESAPWLLGQDAALARPLAERYRTVAGIVQALAERAQRQVEAARRLQPLAEGAPLAARHGTRYPIVQGPMTRVSDTAAFAEAVARAGALPFLALALMRQAEAEKLLRATRDRLGPVPWGAGILGFAPPEIRREQTAAIRAVRPPFALIAGGRPDQARELEKEGIPTYLHVPSPGLLRMFLRDGARRFIFEGRECGGHVGPRSSFVLWEAMVEALLEHLGSLSGGCKPPERGPLSGGCKPPERGPLSGGCKPPERGDDLHILFAGGIHDALSAAMVSALAAPLAERGAAIGVLLGTAYLFTEEAVATGAIVPRFQHEALRCQETVLLETGPGHAIRCLPTPYADAFEREKRRLQEEGKSAEEIRLALEAMNIGRLRIASKGIDRATSPVPVPVPEENREAERDETEEEIGHGQGKKFVALSEEEQLTRGMYMIGQVASLRRRVVRMAELHEDICTGSKRLLTSGATIHHAPRTTHHAPSDIAIIGMACMFPKAGDLHAYWHNIVHRVDAITEVPADHWDWRLYYDADPPSPHPSPPGGGEGGVRGARDKITSKWGGFLDDIPFDPLAYGMPPASLRSIEPMQLLLLEAVRRALADAGYAERPFDRERTAVILGAGGGAAQLSMAYGFRSYLPMLAHVPGLRDLAPQIVQKAAEFLPELTEDSFPGILLNVAAGRVANRFNLGGPNFSVDAACGSSLAALYAGVRELESGGSDLAVVMGADTVQNPFTYLLFSKTHAFSPRGRCSTFDESADGIVISEGVGVVLLKRLADAERDGDRIYAVIKGVGASSDGKDKGLTAPRPEGQRRALERAYAKAGIAPARVGLVEAHGTGTVVGDQTEVQALGELFRAAGAAARGCAIGSVKSMIGHTKCAAGLAGLISATLALHYKTLPPLLVQRPNGKARFEDSPFFLNTEARPWVHGGPAPRTAGVSAFGFGGTNFHAVLQEYTGDYLDEPSCGLRHWPAELFVWRRPDRATLIEAVQRVHDALLRRARPEPAELAASLARANRPDPAQPTLAVVAGSLDELKEKLAAALSALRSSQGQFHDPRGVFFAERPAERGDKVAFLFPGQGSQYPDMLAPLALAFPEVRQAFDEAERALADRLERPLGKFIFPPSAFTPEQEQENRRALTRTDVAQPALGAASLAMFRLLTGLGMEPDFLAGHSYGDYAALCAAGALRFEDLIRLSHRRGRVIREVAERMPGGMAAIDAAAEVVEQVIARIPGVTAANRNSPRQTVISGTSEAIDRALEQFQQQGIRGQRIPVACGFHSPLVAAAREPLALALAECAWATPRRPVLANTTAAPYPAEPAALVALLADHLAAPVRFQEEIEALYQAGVRVFVEVGPQGVLTGLVGQTLADRPHLAVASDQKGRPGLVQLQHLLAQLLVHGVPVRLDRLYEGRQLRTLDLARLGEETGRPALPPSTWLVNSTRARPLNGPEPKLLGPAPPAAPTDPILESVKVTEPTPKPPTPEPPRPAAAALNGHAHQPPPPAGVVSDQASQVVLRFQDLMARFLDTQRSVMLSYLQGSSAAPPSLPAVPTPLAAPLSNGHAAPHRSLPVAAQTAPAEENGRPTPPPAPVKEEPSRNGPSREELTARLLQIVCQRTGYPPEMLGLDLDLEADLGIDSIKRVEILGSLSGATGSAGLTVEMEKLTGIKTLRGIIDCLASDQGSGVRSQGAGAESDRPTGGAVREEKRPVAPRAGIQRMLVRPTAAPLPEDWSLGLAAGSVLITDDGRGVAQILAARLRETGRDVLLLLRSEAAAARNSDGHTLHAELTDPAAVEEVLRRARQAAGPIAGLIHLLPLAGPGRDEGWQERMRREVKSLFLLARALGKELRVGAGGVSPLSAGRPVLLAATAMGGQFGAGDEPLPESFFPGQGGVAGLVKSLAHEWPEVLVRVVDLDPAESPAEHAAQLFAELGDADGPVEIGYHGGRRVTLECVPAPLEGVEAGLAPLGPDATVLLTGGARGITAACALELARRHRPNLVLVGRSAPPGEEPAATAALTDPARIKAALIARLRGEGRPVAPAAVESAYQRLLQDREIRANLRRLREAGARVHYYQADVRDEQAFGAVLDDIERRFGGIDAVLHGAGVIQDKLVQDKTPESFDRVFGTKVDSALILARRLRPERLKFCAFFASVAGRFGNRGQSDYAAANEVLSKLARHLDRRWPGRVVSIVWGPWSTIGMVSELEEHLGRRGLQMIPPEVGPLFLAEELARGRKGEAEVVIAGDVGQLAERGAPEAPVGAVEGP